MLKDSNSFINPLENLPINKFQVELTASDVNKSEKIIDELKDNENLNRAFELAAIQTQVTPSISATSSIHLKESYQSTASDSTFSSNSTGVTSTNQTGNETTENTPILPTLQLPSIPEINSNSNLPHIVSPVVFTEPELDVETSIQTVEQIQIKVQNSIETQPNIPDLHIRPPLAPRSKSYNSVIGNSNDITDIFPAEPKPGVINGPEGVEVSLTPSKITRRNTYAVSTHSKNKLESQTIDIQNTVPEAQLSKKNLVRRRFTRSKKNNSSSSAANGPNPPNSNPARFGTKVGEGHHNYALMYNMLTGIRVSVSRCTAKVKRPLTRADFLAANKLAFDITGNELTPSSKYDFKFKDYSPWVFRNLRELFGIDPAEYLLSLTLKYILSELSTPGKSGSFFYYSQDFRFIIKTVHHTEHKFFRKILPGYYEHVKANPDTLISRIYGLHRVKMINTSKKIHFVVMANVLPPTKDIHHQFDLKGSTLGRILDENATTKSGLPVVLKDLNWINQHRQLELGSEKRNQLFQQLKSDVDFLARHNIMDYSLLIGIHNLARGNRDGLRQATLSVFDPSKAESINNGQSSSMRYYNDPKDLRRQVAQADPISLKSGTLEELHQLPDNVGEERLQCVFYRDEGGYLATDESNRPAGELYCMGVIDIMTPYTWAKKIEHMVKSINNDSNAISAVDPYTYAHRFLNFITKSLRHHEDLDPQLKEYEASHMSKFHPKSE